MPPLGRAFTVAGVGFILFLEPKPATAHLLGSLRHPGRWEPKAPLTGLYRGYVGFVQQFPTTHRVQTLTLGMPTNNHFFGRATLRTENPSSRDYALYGNGNGRFRALYSPYPLLDLANIPLNTVPRVIRHSELKSGVLLIGGGKKGGAKAHCGNGSRHNHLC